MEKVVNGFKGAWIIDNLSLQEKVINRVSSLWINDGGK